MTVAAECPGCGLSIGDLDDTVSVADRAFHVACAADGAPPIDPAAARSHRRRRDLLVASRIAAGRYVLSSPPLPPDA